MKVLDASARLAVEGVDRPKFYVRGRFKMDYAQNLADIARDAMANADKSLDMSRWPFNDPKKPILVRRVVLEKKDAKTGKVTTEQKSTALDGNHRIEAARILKLTHVPAARIIECSDKEAALAQLSANVEQGLFLDRASRNAFIKAMLEDKELRVTQKEVAAITHLSTASINRILKDKQGARSASSKKMAKGAKKSKKGARVQQTFSTRTWFAELVSIAGDFDKHSAALISASKGKTFKVSEAFRDFAGEIKGAE